MKLCDYGFTENEFLDLLETANRAAVTSNEMDFVARISDKYEQYKLNTFMSVKQLDWLKRIAKVA